MSTTNLLEEQLSDGGDQLCYQPRTESLDEESIDFLIFMITGNPGLIDYYEPFLSTLHTLLCSSPSSVNSRFFICGNSLLGFNIRATDFKNQSSFPVRLQDQIENTEKALFSQIHKYRRATAKRNVFPKVILMGHSVGAYILLELISQHRKRIDEGQEDFDLIGGILLFPTITYLARSPQGKIYDVR